MNWKLTRGAIIAALTAVVGVAPIAVEARSLCGRGYIRYLSTGSVYQPAMNGQAPWLVIALDQMPEATGEYGYYHGRNVIAVTQKAGDLFQFESHFALLMNTFSSRTPVIIRGGEGVQKHCYGTAENFEITYCRTQAECGL
jgi:hypothetical protein